MRSGPSSASRDRVVDHRLGAALLDLAHEVPAHALRLHPLEDLGRRPVAAQADLDEVAAADRAGLDEPAHRRAVAGQHAPVVGRGVGMGVEVDDADAARPADLGDGRGGRPGDRVVAAEDDRDGARCGRPRGPCGRSWRGRARARPARCSRRRRRRRQDPTARRPSWSEWIDPPCSRLADRPRPEAGARPVADAVVERRADDRHVRRAGRRSAGSPGGALQNVGRPT